MMISLLGSSFSSAVLASTADRSDIQGHWAQEQIAAWIAKGLVKGYDDGRFKLDHPITRAEFIVLVNRTFGFSGQSDISFTDVSATHWAYADMAKAVHAGYMTGYADGTIGASVPISRQEVAVIVSRLLKLDTTQAKVDIVIEDAADIAAWSKGAIYAVVGAQLMKGYSADHTFKPEALITRAEAIVTLDRAAASQTVAYDKAGTYGPAEGVEHVHRNVEVHAPGVTLRNMVINGDLLLAEGIGTGDAFLDNVKVTGKVTVRGGGENSIHFNNSVLVDVVIDKRAGTGIVRIVSEGATTVALVVVNSPATINSFSTTGSGIGNVNISSSLPAGSKVKLQGTFETVNVSSTQIQVDLPEGSIQQINVGSAATGSSINLGQGTKVNSLVLDTVVSMLGQGTVVAAKINMPGTTFEKPPTSSNVPAPTPAPPVAPSVPSNSGSSGSSPDSPPQHAPTASSVSVSGVVTVGETLTGSYVYADQDGNQEAGSTYQWYRSDDLNATNRTPIQGATSTAYTLQQADVGKYITFEVTPKTATVPTTGAAVESTVTAAVVKAPAAPTAKNVAISGAAVEGETLTGSYTYGDVNGDAEAGTTYQWYRSDDLNATNRTPIQGAVSTAYTLQQADVGKYITFEVTPKTATVPTTGAAVESTVTAVVVKAPTAPIAINVAISGVAVEGQTLTGSYTYGDVNGDVEAGSTYQWYRSDDLNATNRTPIQGAVSTAYTLQQADVGKYITFEVTPKNAIAPTTGTAVESTVTAAVVKAPAAPTATNVAISGAAVEGETLTGSYTYGDVNGDAEAGTTYQWYRSDDLNATNRTPIQGATSTAYTLQQADVGKYITFEVTPKTATVPTTGAAVESTVTAAVVKAPAAPTATNVAISGAAVEGETLTGSYTYGDVNGDAEAGTTYQWYRSDDLNATNRTPIQGAVSTAYTLQQADVGKYITFEVTPKTATVPTTGAAVESTVTAVVVKAPTAPIAINVAISGVAVEGQTLTGSYTYGDVNGDVEAGSTYQWYRSDDLNATNRTPIQGAVSTAYTLQQADVGKYMFFEVTPKNVVAPTTGTAAEQAMLSAVRAMPVVELDPSLSNYMPLLRVSHVNAGTQVKVYNSGSTTLVGSGEAAGATAAIALDALSPGVHDLQVTVTDGMTGVTLLSQTLNHKVRDIHITPDHQLSAGAGHLAVLATDGQVYTWGANWTGGIGDGTTTAHPERFAVPGLPSDIIAVQAGFDHTMILTAQGHVWKWGRGAGATPAPVQGLDHVVSISSEGGTMALALKSDGTVWAWNSYGAPTKVEGLDHVIAIQGRYASAYALKADGTVWAWGSNDQGQLGNGTTESGNTPVQVTGLTNVVSMHMGNMHGVVLTDAGTVYTWGFNLMGQVGNGTTENQLVPVQVPGLSNIDLISAGNYYTFARDTNGQIYAWGYNGNGQLGFGHYSNVDTPTVISGLTDVVAITGGGGNTAIALKSDGTVWTWGDGGYGTLGDGSTGSRLVPGMVSDFNLFPGVPVITLNAALSNHMPVVVIGNLVAGQQVTVSDSVYDAVYGTTTTVVATGTAEGYKLTLALDPLRAGEHLITVQVVDPTGKHQTSVRELTHQVNPVTITPRNQLSEGAGHIAVLATDGQVYTWGANWTGGIGDGTTSARTERFAVPGLPSDIIAVQAGFDHTMILTTQGKVWKWGRGAGTTPAVVPGLDHIVAIGSEGGTLAVALKSDGTVWAWDSYSAPTKVDGLKDVIAVRGSYSAAYALKADGTVWAWGMNDRGQLGNGTTDHSNTPVQVIGLSNVVSLYTGNMHGVALTNDGTVYAWGFNEMGQVGNGTTANQLTAVQVPGLSHITMVSAGDYNTFARDASGQIYSWGYNGDGQLGFGHYNNTNTPAVISGMTDVVAMTGGGGNTTIALKSDGTVWTWGDGYNGLLGNGDHNGRTTPGSVDGFNLMPTP